MNDLTSVIYGANTNPSLCSCLCSPLFLLSFGQSKLFSKEGLIAGVDILEVEKNSGIRKDFVDLGVDVFKCSPSLLVQSDL